MSHKAHKDCGLSTGQDGRKCRLEGGLACKYYCLPGANNESRVEKDVILASCT